MAKFKPEIKLEHSDSRGEIYSIALPGDRELMLLRSNSGVLRGGHYHDCDEIVVVLSGQMRYHKIIDGREIERTLTKGNQSFNPAYENHMGEFLDETWLIEYKFAKKGEWKQVDYKPFRDQVRASII